jgi:hypothetical protein
VHLEDEPRALPSSRSRRSIATIATLMMSAFEPCITKLTATRSPKPRVARFRTRSSGTGRRRPSRLVDVAVALGLLDRAGDEVLHEREAREVGVDVLLRLLARDLEVLGEAEGRDPVDDPEVDHLRDRALRRGQLRRLDAEHLGRGRGVDVLPALERLAELRLAGDVREDPQLDLRVVGGDEARARLRDERRADLAPELRADRDRLEVRARRREAAGRGDGLVERRVQAPVVADQRRAAARGTC